MIDGIIETYKNFSVLQYDITANESSMRKVQINGKQKLNPSPVGFVYKERNNSEQEIYVSFIHIDELIKLREVNSEITLKDLINLEIRSLVDSYLLSYGSRKGYAIVLHHTHYKDYVGLLVFHAKPELIVGKTYRKIQ